MFIFTLFSMGSGSHENPWARCYQAPTRAKPVLGRGLGSCGDLSLSPSERPAELAQAPTALEIEPGSAGDLSGKQ